MPSCPRNRCRNAEFAIFRGYPRLPRSRAPDPHFVKLLLALAWFLVSAGFAPVGLGRAHGALSAGPPVSGAPVSGAPRSISAAEHQVDLPRPGERAAADWQAGRGRTTGGHAAGSAELIPESTVGAIPAWADASEHSFPATAARTARPRRMRFPTEATAPPESLS